MAAWDARRKEVALKLELNTDAPAVRADPIQIEQVVLNLIRNAVEAIDEDKPARREVLIRTGLGPDNSVEVAVHDTGPGVPVRETETIFEPFFTTKAGGMGMGLSISRSIIDTHGARLECTSNPDGGSIFRFTLPATQGGTVQ